MRHTIGRMAALGVFLIGGTLGASAQQVRGHSGDVEYDNQYGLSIIGAQRVHKAGYTGAGVNVGILDSGLDVGHPEFAGRLSGISFDYYAQGPVTFSRHWHGTHVAGTIGAARDHAGMLGVAPEALISPFTLLNESNIIPTMFDREMAVRQLYDVGLANGVRLFNNSWGTSTVATDLPRDEFEIALPYSAAAYRKVAAHGGLVVFSTGNSGMEQPGADAAAPYFLPELQPHWIAVTAVGPSTIASYANLCGVAREYCIAAPGGDRLLVDGQTVDALIYSTFPGSIYGFSGGTSMAAPHVTGAAAVARQMFPEASWPEIGQIVLRTAADIGAPGIDDVFGWGLLDLGAMLDTLSPSGSALFANAAWARSTTLDAVSDAAQGRIALRRGGAGAEPIVPLGYAAAPDLSGSAAGAGTFWTQALYGGATIAGQPGGPGASAGFGGALLGWDTTLDGGHVAGGAVGWTFTDLSGRGTGDRASAQGLHALAYLGLESGPAFLDMSAAIARFGQSHERAFIPGTERTVLSLHGLTGRSSHAIFGYSLSARGGYGIETGGALRAEPFVHASWTGQHAGAMRESADIFGLEVVSATHGQGEAGIGIKVAAPFAYDGAMWTPELTLAYGRGFGDAAFRVDSALLGTPIGGSSARLGRDIVSVGAEMRYRGLAGRTEGFVGYSGSFRANAHAHSVSGGFTLRF